jgi:hypothetical protein
MLEREPLEVSRRLLEEAGARVAHDMKEEAFQALDEIMDALRVILEDPHFKPVSDRPRSWISVTWDFLRNGLQFHDESLIRANLAQIRKHSPSKLDVLDRAFTRGLGMMDMRSIREQSTLNQIAMAPLILPRAFSVWGLFKFSTREAQFGAYYIVWFVELMLACAVIGWLAPVLVPGIVVWFVAAEFVDKDLELEEAMSQGYLFSLLVFAGNIELVLELCREKGIELGKLLQVSEQFVLFEMGAAPTDSQQEC